MRRRLFTALWVLSLVLCLSTLAMWLRSLQGVRYDLSIGDSDPNGGLTLLDGLLSVYIQSERSLEENPDSTGDFQIGFASFWCYRDSDHADRRNWGVQFPFWIVPMLSEILPSVCIIRRRRRKGPGFCRQCDYDLRGTPDRCPECGTVAMHRPV